MKLSSAHLSRYRAIATLLWKYGHSDVVKQMSAEDSFELDPKTFVAAEGQATPEQLVNDLEAMGPTYVKLGQVLAGRPDLLPDAYRLALERLQDKVKPFPFAEAEQIVASELGVRISKAFATFEDEPLAAASLGQVHAATLRDGRQVVVKIQRPNIRQQIAEDFEVLASLANLMDQHTEMGRRHRFSQVLEEFRLTLQQELNYEREAHNLITVGKNLQKFPHLRVPQPIAGYFTRSVLTMERIQGRKITALGPLAQMDLNGSMLAEELFQSYLQQVLVDGLFHADPHPGNVFVTDDGNIALIDLGQVGHSSPTMQENLLKILVGVSEGNGENAAEVAIRMSEKLDDFSPAEFRRRIAQLVALRRDQGLEQMNVGRSLLDVSSIARDNGLLVPSDLVVLGKTLLQLDEVGRILDPKFDPNASVRRNVTMLMTQRMKRDLSQGSVYSSLLEAKDFATGLPTRLNRIMDAITNSELEVKVRATDAKLVMDGMQKIANRITAGIILAGLVVGASLLMRLPTHFQLFGFPGLAILCFLAAASGGFWLVISIFVQDYRSRKKFPR